MDDGILMLLVMHFIVLVQMIVKLARSLAVSISRSDVATMMIGGGCCWSVVVVSVVVVVEGGWRVKKEGGEWFFWWS